MRVTQRVKKILDNYSSDSPGTKTNIARMLSNGRLGGTGERRRRARPAHLAAREVQVEDHGASGLEDERELVPAEVMRCACGTRRHRLAGP